MRIILIIAFAFPFFLNAQINRSATEFARENVQVYIENKLFKDHSYKPVSYGELTSVEKSNGKILWGIQHSFEILQTKVISDRKISSLMQYKFSFYLDKKMNVLRAEGSPGLN